MRLTDPSSSWIWSIRSGDPIASASQTADLQQHNTKGNFQIDLSKSSGGNSVNPFAKSATSTSSGTAAATTTASGGETTAGGGGDQGGEPARPPPTQHVRVIAHGVLMCLAFL